MAAELLKLDKAIDKMNSKKQPVASSSNAAVDAEFASFEHLQWFIRSEDASRAHFNPSPVVSESGRPFSCRSIRLFNLFIFIFSVASSSCLSQ